MTGESQLKAKVASLEAEIMAERFVRNWFINARSQNDNEESRYLASISGLLETDRSFIEFGFSLDEFNSISLVKAGFRGLLLDPNQETVDRSNFVFERLRLPTRAVRHWVTASSLAPLEIFIASNKDRLGVLNVDIDGVDYWVLQAALKLVKPEVICVEHNASLGLRSITVPYDERFDRHEKHASGMYHGASISAFANLLYDEYALVRNIKGLNLVFARRDRIRGRLEELAPHQAYSECYLRNLWSGTSAEAQWSVICHLPYIEV